MTALALSGWLERSYLCLLSHGFLSIPVESEIGGEGFGCRL